MTALLEGLLTWFVPQPAPHERPARLTSPFDAEGPPHQLAARAAQLVMASLRQGEIAQGVSTQLLHGPEGGKMFGVLTVEAADGRVGFLKAISGQLARRWDVPGFVPPVFDRGAREAVEIPGELQVKALTRRVDEARQCAQWAEAKVALAQWEKMRAREQQALREKHEVRRGARQVQRELLNRQGRASDEAMEALNRQSQADDAELRHAKRAWRSQEIEHRKTIKRFERRFSALERLRRLVSQAVSASIYATYVFRNALGEQVSLRDLFAPRVPSSGTGDCAAPKLLAFSLAHGLKPLALAEFWWGAPPLGGGRKEGHFFPACRDKCGPLLPFLLKGLDAAPSRRFRPTSFSSLELEVLFRDEWMVVVNKPEGLLSVPGTDETVTDSLLGRLKARFPKAQGPLLVHRLDLETSGLLLVALDAQTHRHLQRLFLTRDIYKEYVAILEGVVQQERGTIDLPLRVDLEQRPRQMVDWQHGKSAVTEFQVLGREGRQTRVALFPKTGRTHQLRVHASHPQGLGVPIVGDRLYGTAAVRLLLHAQSLRFRHPASGEIVTVTAPAPF